MQTPTILLVEDEPLIRSMLAEILREAHYQVIEAVNGDAGMSVLCSGQSVDLILTDVRMPGKVDGIALTEFSKRECPRRPVIVVSGHLAPDAANIADRFLSKPFFPSKVLQTIEMLLA
jgi:CheY-like chemotaxis protein